MIYLHYMMQCLPHLIIHIAMSMVHLEILNLLQESQNYIRLHLPRPRYKDQGNYHHYRQGYMLHLSQDKQRYYNFEM